MDEQVHNSTMLCVGGVLCIAQLCIMTKRIESCSYLCCLTCKLCKCASFWAICTNTNTQHLTPDTQVPSSYRLGVTVLKDFEDKDYSLSYGINHKAVWRTAQATQDLLIILTGQPPDSPVCQSQTLHYYSFVTSHAISNCPLFSLIWPPFFGPTNLPKQS